jgi:hypothetical protein
MFENLGKMWIKGFNSCLSALTRIFQITVIIIFHNPSNP